MRSPPTPASTHPRYVQLDRLGKGSFGEVFLCLDTRDDKRYAMKMIKRAMGGISTETVSDNIAREIAVLKKLRHRNLVILKEVIDDPSQVRESAQSHLLNGKRDRSQETPELSLPLFTQRVLIFMPSPGF